MPHHIRVHTPIAYDPAIVACALDEPALPVDVSDRVLAPFSTIDGRNNVTTSNFLRHHTLGTPNLTTARRLAYELSDDGASSIPGVAVALEARGDRQRLLVVLSSQHLHLLSNRGLSLGRGTQPTSAIWWQAEVRRRAPVRYRLAAPRDTVGSWEARCRPSRAGSRRV